MKPAEGTVLTVSRLAAARAEEAAQEQNCAEYVLAEAIATGYETLAETTEMNPVLKKAGVVDAGGKGYLIILEGMLSSLRGEPMPEVEEEPEHDKADFAAIGDEDITFAFDTVFIVRKNDPNVDLAPFRAYLDSIGDSLVIGEDDESFKVHVHTDTPGEALTAAQRYGTLELAKIENMRTQAADLAAGQQGPEHRRSGRHRGGAGAGRAGGRSPAGEAATAFWRYAPETDWRRPSGIWAWIGWYPAARP